MAGFLASQLRHRAGRALTLALGIVVATVAFVLLTSSAATSAIHVRSTLQKNFRGAYDILVRPRARLRPLSAGGSSGTTTSPASTAASPCVSTA